MIIPVLLLIVLGITVIYSSSVNLAIVQLISAIIGLILYFTLRGFDYRSLRVLIKPLYLLIFICLVITLFLGIETRGSVRWIMIGSFNFQPSEFAKPVLILALAHFWSKNAPSWKNICISLLILMPFAALIFRQPDLGTTLTAGFIWFSMLLASNIPFKKLAILSLIVALMMPLGYFTLQDYQKQRITSFLSPTSDPQGIGFHVIQSMIAVGSGEFLGRGIGRGTQSRLQFVPEFRTDFIFAFIAEELGFIGTTFVLILYLTLFLLLFKTLSQVGDRFGELIIVGVTGMLFFQMTINIGMNIGLLPITGITLPLLSYGGSSMITTLVSLGLITSITKFGLQKRKIPIFSPFGNL